MSFSNFFQEMYTGVAPTVKDGFSALLNGYKEIEIAKASAPLQAAKADQASVLGTPNTDVSNAQSLTPNQYNAAAHAASNNLTGVLGGLPDWAKLLLGLSLALLAVGVTAKLVKG